MKIDVGTATVMLIVVAFLVLPFLLDHRRRSRSGLHLLGNMKEAARQQQCVLHKHEINHDVGLGIDRDKRVLFFISQRTGSTALRIMHLEQVRSCRVIKDVRGGKHAQPGEAIDRVELNFMPYGPGGSEVGFVLYHHTNGSSVNGEIQLAEKWAGLVNDLLKK